MEGIAKIILAINETLKTVSGLNNTMMLWVLMVSIIVTSFVCLYMFAISKRLKKSERLHEECLDDKKRQDEKIEALDRSYDGIVAANEQIKDQLTWQQEFIEDTFNKVVK